MIVLGSIVVGDRGVTCSLGSLIYGDGEEGSEISVEG